MPAARASVLLCRDINLWNWKRSSSSRCVYLAESLARSNDFAAALDGTREGASDWCESSKGICFPARLNRDRSTPFPVMTWLYDSPYFTFSNGRFKPKNARVYQASSDARWKRPTIYLIHSVFSPREIVEVFEKVAHSLKVCFVVWSDENQRQRRANISFPVFSNNSKTLCIRFSTSYLCQCLS